jgi:hypothetical protein
VPTVISAKKHDKIVDGHKRFEKGLMFETKVADYYSQQGFKINSRHRDAIGEIDLIATRSHFTGTDILMIECKNKELVSLNDFVKFVGKFMKFDKRHGGKAGGIFAYKGRLDAKVKTYYLTMDRKWKRGIALKRF